MLRKNFHENYVKNDRAIIQNRRDAGRKIARKSESKFRTFCAVLIALLLFIDVTVANWW